MWMSHVTPVNESCHTYEWVMVHISMSHGTHVNESWHTCEGVMTKMYMSQRQKYFLCATWLIHMCDMTHIHKSHKTQSHVCNVTNTNEQFHTCMLGPRQMDESHCKHTCESLQAHMWVTASTHVTRVTPSTHVKELWHICKLVMAHMRMNHGTHVNESCHTYIPTLQKIDESRT